MGGEVRSRKRFDQFARGESVDQRVEGLSRAIY